MCKASHSGSNLGSNLTYPKTILLMWQVFNEERCACGNIICYCNIALSEAKGVYEIINEAIYDTTTMLLCTMGVVTYTSVICMALV